MKSIAIIDDEYAARQSLRTLLNSLCPEAEICGEAGSVEEGYKLICQTKPHAVLLDITMEDGSGFDLLERFQNPNFKVIFTTAHDEFALKAFRVHALDYLLKPINPIELVQAIDHIKIETSVEYQTKVTSLLDSIRVGHIDKIYLTSHKGMVFLSINKIVRLESDGNYTSFWMKNHERHVVSRSLKEFEDILDPLKFFRVHQSHLISLSYVNKILKEDGDYAVMHDGFMVPIARRRKDEFIDLMKRKFIT
jgi:two-component system LytT family response regulator